MTTTTSNPIAGQSASPAASPAPRTNIRAAGILGRQQIELAHRLGAVARVVGGKNRGTYLRAGSEPVVEKLKALGEVNAATITMDYPAGSHRAGQYAREGKRRALNRRIAELDLPFTAACKIAPRLAGPIGKLP